MSSRGPYNFHVRYSLWILYRTLEISNSDFVNEILRTYLLINNRATLLVKIIRSLA